MVHSCLWCYNNCYNLEFVISGNWFSISHNSWQLRFYLNIMQSYIIFISFISRQKSLTPRMKLIDGTKWDLKICTFAWIYLSVSKNSVSLSTSNKQITCIYLSWDCQRGKIIYRTSRHHLDRQAPVFSAATSYTSNKGHINIIMDCMKFLLTPIYYKACWPSARGFKAFNRYPLKE